MEDRMSRRLHLPLWAVALLFTVLGFLMYGVSLHNEFLVWDDRYLIRDNPIVQRMSFATLKAAFSTFDPELYIPLTFLSYQIDYLIGGSSPLLYHVTSLLLHIANALLAFLLLRRLGRSTVAALIAGAVFLVHPINVEAVAWMSARKDVLSTCFALLSLVLYARYCSRRGWTTYALSIAAFLLALLSKVSVLLLPAVLILIDVALRRPINARTLAEKIPYGALSVLLSIVAIIGKSHTLQQLTLVQTFLLACRDTASHILGMLWPFGFSAIYPYTNPVALASPDITLSVAVVLMLAMVCLWSMRRTKTPAVALAIFFIFLLPSFTTFSKPDGIMLGSDRYVYLAWIGPLLLLAWGLDTLLPRISTVKSRALQALMIVIIAVLGMLTIRQSMTWRTTQTLFDTVLRFYPDSIVSRINIAVSLRDKGDIEGAMRYMQEALAISPTAKVHSITASIHRASGDHDDAKREYQAALALQPAMAEALFGLGLVYEDEGDIESAVEQYERALTQDPDLEGAHNNLGSLYLRQGRYAEAQEHYRQALSINPFLKLVRFNLGLSYQREGKLSEARDEFTNAIMIDPDYADAHANLAAVYLLQNNQELAQEHVQKALKIAPEHPVALQVWAVLSRER